jgi:endogenous inhibitor of DNA gyrase (YacG/DUF329 family)
MREVTAAAAARKKILNRLAPVSCAACGRKVARKSRQQRFCSDRCREWDKGQRRVRKSFLGTDTRAALDPLFLSNKVNGVQRQNSESSIPLNILGGYRWPNADAIDRELLRKIVRAEIGDAP